MSWVGVGTFVVGTGVGLWQGDKAKKEAEKQQKAAQAAYAQQQAAEAAAAAAAARRAADEAAARAIINDANTKAKKAQTNRLIIGISVVGGTVLTIATIMVVALRRK